MKRATHSQRQSRNNLSHLCLLVTLAATFAVGALALGRSHADPSLVPEFFANRNGMLQTVTTNGLIDTSNPFFQSLGTNGRACVTCHQPGKGWSITPENVQVRFDASQGLDPIFRTNDGSNSPNADVSTMEARRKAYGMLLTKGLIRVGLSIPTDGEFELADVDDPYGYASARELSLFRRPLPSTNLRFLSGVMWDGRETVQPITGPAPASVKALQAGLTHQALDAALGHAQASSPPTAAQLQQIIDFEMGLYTAQAADNAAGPLDAQDGRGGPQLLTEQKFFIGINDPLGLNPTGAPFDPKGFTLFSRWASLPGRGADRYTPARWSVARGEITFNTKTITLTGVAGLNDELGQPSLSVHCTTCHSTPNVGNHSVAAPLNIGISDAERRTPDMPLYTLRNKTTGELVRTTDPGRALITGKWKDIGKFKGPILRGLAARAPYFHNGSAATLRDVVDFYDRRFSIRFTPEEKADLVAFLRSL
jgi:cytochrome c peroxidase